MTRRARISRRDFVRHSALGAAVVGLSPDGLSGLAGPGIRQERFPVVAREPWARVSRLADGIWAVVSDPLTDRTTLCNGGIIAGRNGVVVVDAYGSEAGARWVVERALELTGRVPTHLVLTHYHGDHTAGVAGMRASGDPEILVTEVTRDLIVERNGGASAQALEGASVLGARRPTEIDLGDRSLIVVPRRGHTPSDVTVEVPEQGVVFCGDLVWNGMFPNYVDATPSRLSQAVRLLAAGGTSVFVPGHGTLADSDDMRRYTDVLDDVEAAARSAIEGGVSAEEAGASYRLPTGTEDWTLFNPGYFGRAIGAWMRELGAS